MDNTKYKLAGMAAIALAVLFPIYWIATFGLMIDNAEMTFSTDFLELSGWDILFVTIGALEIYVYFSLSKYFRDQIGGGFIANMLLAMAFFVALFHSTVAVDILLGLGLFPSIAETIIDVTLVAGIVLLLLYSFALIAMCSAMLARFIALPNTLKLFAVGMLIAAVLQLTLVLAVVNIVLFPALMLLLAYHFLTDEHAVEVV
ncbi:hypothetical protein [Pseudidiomarina woesei]|uniref:Uncharacterized protein n=1 Tax=Pseudidiomarina woesei TaxID=1381080 RepID=A0A0K6H4N0_9GAMM|nr:hypothetical protein [Pseudidiomarina woesei]CUA85861.1 hypothetical protein Ga0061064_1334 [Pseudidiomarina woesei]